MKTNANFTQAATAALSPGLDLSYLEARTLVTTGTFKQVKILLVGVGGTGSWLAAHLVRLAKIVGQRTTRLVEVKFIDPDTVEEINLDRQNFCQAEIGFNKAETLAHRYTLATGLEVISVPAHFQPEHLNSNYEDLVIVVGCVDNAEARQELHQTLNEQSSYSRGKVFWLDCGNYHNGGNVLLGNTSQLRTLQSSFEIEPWCTALPSPALQHPELLKPLPDELKVGRSNNPANLVEELSCEQMAIRTTQSLTINQSIAAVASIYLVKLLSGQLKYFQTYLNLDAMVIKSTYITPHSVAASIGQDVSFFSKEHRKLDMWAAPSPT